MSDTNELVARLLELAQSGQAAQTLARAERELLTRTGDVAGLHFVRNIALLNMAEPQRAAAATDDLVAAAEREGSAGWLACGLSTRASGVLRESERTSTDYDLEAVLRDMVTAERVIEGETAPIPAINGRVGIALGYLDLRLYELIEPHYEAAYAISAARPDDNGNCAMWLCNLAELHLYWALELRQVGQHEAAAEHARAAERAGLRGAAEARGPGAPAWRAYALLAVACAHVDTDPAGAAEAIATHLADLNEQGLGPVLLAFCRPFQGIALSRAGRHAEALAVMRLAIEELPADVTMLIAAATYRTYAQLMAGGGSAGAGAGLRYGDTLAATLWQHRLRTLHSVATMKSMETLRARADSATRALDVDALTGIANRRAFDNAVESAQRASAGTATVLLIDTDKFKQINDTRGHAAGDSVLRAIASALVAQVREQDLVARLGGDEFAALLPSVGEDVAARVASRMVQAVRDLPDCPATLSIGVASGPAHLLPDTVIRADEAMYRVKRAGGDAVGEAAVTVGNAGLARRSMG